MGGSLCTCCKTKRYFSSFRKDFLHFICCFHILPATGVSFCWQLFKAVFAHYLRFENKLTFFACLQSHPFTCSKAVMVSGASQNLEMGPPEFFGWRDAIFVFVFEAETERSDKSWDRSWEAVSKIQKPWNDFSEITRLKIVKRKLTNYFEQQSMVSHWLLNIRIQFLSTETFFMIRIFLGQFTFVFRYMQKIDSIGDS